MRPTSSTSGLRERALLRRRWCAISRIGKNLAVVWAVSVAFAASGTECITIPPKILFKQAEAVFVGVVVETRKAQDLRPDRITYRVERGFKNATFGELIAQDAYLDLYSPAHPGQRHLVFAATSQILASCSHSGPLDPIPGRRESETGRLEETRTLLSWVERRAWWWRNPLSSFTSWLARLGRS